MKKLGWFGVKFNKKKVIMTNYDFEVLLRHFTTDYNQCSEFYKNEIVAKVIEKIHNERVGKTIDDNKK